MFNYNKLQELLQSRSVKQKELAEEVCRSESTISRIMEGDLEPSLKLAGKIADYFGVKVDDLLTKNE